MTSLVKSLHELVDSTQQAYTVRNITRHDIGRANKKLIPDRDQFCFSLVFKLGPRLSPGQFTFKRHDFLSDGVGETQ